MSFYLKNIERMTSVNVKSRTSNALMPFGFAASLKRRKTMASNDSDLRFSEVVNAEKSKGGTFKNSI